MLLLFFRISNSNHDREAQIRKLMYISGTLAAGKGKKQNKYFIAKMRNAC